MRDSSHIIMRIHVARSGTSTSSSRSTAMRVHELVGEVRRVVHARDVGRALHVGELLTGLLHAGVEVTDDGLDAQHVFAVELHHEPQHAVGRRVLRTHVDDHRVAEIVLRPHAAARDHELAGACGRSSCAPSSVWRSRRSSSRRQASPGGFEVGRSGISSHVVMLLCTSFAVRLACGSRFEAARSAASSLRLRSTRLTPRCAPAPLAASHNTESGLSSWARVSLERHGNARRGIVLAQRVTVPVVGHEDAREIGMTVEGDAEEVVRLALGEVRAGVDRRERRDRRVATRAPRR